MIETIRKKIKERAAFGRLRRHFEPRKEFLEKSRTVFLSALRDRFPEVKLASQTFMHGRAFRYGISFAAILVLLNGGMVVLADKQNVPASSPLYPYKRISENVQLTLSSPQQQPVLRKQFAARRLEEIKMAESQEKSNTDKVRRINELSADFHDEINAALASFGPASAGQNAPSQSAGTGTIVGKPSVHVRLSDDEEEGGEIEDESDAKVLCQSFGNLISEHDALVSSSPSFGWSEFKEKCGD